MKKIVLLLFILVSIGASSQNLVSDTNKNKMASISLTEFVARIKAQNESLKNAKNIQVMVNDLLIENADTFLIDPKNVAKMEVLVLEPNGINREATQPSIIIYTKIK
jgi:ABC-type transporter MlaC component